MAMPAGQRSVIVAVAFVAVAVVGAGCDRPKNYDTTVEILQLQKFGADSKMAGVMDMELKFTDCPGDARRLVRADKAFTECAWPKLKEGDKVPATVTFSYSSERQNYRADFVKIADCAIKMDPKEMANYEMVQVCTELKSTGATVGVHCDRTRSKALVDKCPWLRRN